MVESWIFMAAFLVVSLLVVFHGLVLLTLPELYIPTYDWGRPAKLELLRKPSLDFGKRSVGFCGVAFGAWMAWHALSWMFHPTASRISWGNSPFPPGTPRWELLAFGVFAFGGGCYLVLRPGRLVRGMFSAKPQELQNPITLRLWTLHARLFGAVMLLFSALLLSQFAASLR
jgi:hypothetical protein